MVYREKRKEKHIVKMYKYIYTDASIVFKPGVGNFFNTRLNNTFFYIFFLF